MKKIIFLFLTFVFSHSILFATTYKVLFIGNSYTASNNLADLTNKVAETFGDTIVFQTSTFGGYTFQQHNTNNNTIDKINSQDWDFVTLQEQSQIPSFPPSQVASDCYPYAEQLVDLIENNSDCSKALFFMTWGRQNGDAGNCPFYEPLCTYEGMQQRLIESYTEMAETNGVSVAPVGVAWRTVREQTQDAINLYTNDGSHPNIYGSYLAACVFYSAMFQKSAVGAASPDAISDEDAEILQTIASETVLNDLDSWFIEETENSPVPCVCSFLEGAAAFETINEMCENDEAIILGSANDENDYFEGTNVSVVGENYVFTPSTETGDIEINHIITDGNCEDVATQSITVFEFVEAGFNDLAENYSTADEAVVLVPNNENGEHTFSGEGVENGVFYPNMVTTLDETISITQVVTNGLCTDSTTQTLVVSFPLGIKNEFEKTIEIYPTISNQSIFVNTRNMELKTLELFDIAGRQVNQSLIFEKIGNNTYQIDVSELQSAYYILRVGDGTAFFSEKIIVCE